MSILGYIVGAFFTAGFIAEEMKDEKVWLRITMTMAWPFTLGLAFYDVMTRKN